MTNYKTYGGDKWKEVNLVLVRREQALTYGDGPDSGDLHHRFGSGVEAAVLDGVPDGDVAVQRDGAQVHDGGGGEEHVQVDPDGAERVGERPGIVWGETEDQGW